MRRLVLVLAAGAMMLAACKGGSGAKLEGRWRGIKASGVASSEVGAANLFASAMELEFKGEQVSVHTGSDKQSAHFKIVKDDKTQVTLTTDQDGPDDPQVFTFVDDHTMTWAIAPGKTIQFQKE
jgi:hypothetical protein